VPHRILVIIIIIIHHLLGFDRPVSPSSKSIQRSSKSSSSIWPTIQRYFCHPVIDMNDMIRYDIWYMIRYDVIWNDTIRYDMIYDMIRYDTIWCDMKRYDMIYGMIWYDIGYDIWYDTICYAIYDMIWYTLKPA